MKRMVFWAMAALFLAVAPSRAKVIERPAPLRVGLIEPLVQGTIGGKASLRIRLELDPGWHTYPPTSQRNADGEGPYPLQATVESPASIRLEGPPSAAPVVRRKNDGFAMTVSQIEGEAWVEVPLRLDSSLKPGRHPGTLRVSYQACTERNCLPQTTVDVPFTVEARPGPAPSAEASAMFSAAEPSMDASAPSKGHSQPPITATEQEIHRRKHEGFWAFLGFAMLAGVMALLTPCVFPMVPITVSFFTVRAQGQGARTLRDAFLYGTGIVATFTALGLIVALVFGAAGIQTFATSPWVNLVIAAIFLVFALNLFGAMEIRLPSFVLTRLGSQSGSGVMSVLLMGLTFTLTSFTCTVPFVGSALLSASRGEWFYPVVGMLGFSGVFALPFVLLALFPAAMVRLPRAGAWMNRMKVVMGFLEVAAAIKFLSNADLALGTGLLSRELFLAIWAACALLILLYLLGVFRLLRDEPSERIGAFRALWAVVFGTLLFVFLSGLQGRPMGELDAFLPPRADPGPALATGSQEDAWLTDFTQASEASKRTGKPLFIDFTGYTCTNCRWMEQNMFTRPAVAQRLGECIRVRLHTDRQVQPDLGNKQLQQARFDSIELPLYALLTPDARVLGTCSFTRNEAEFLEFLNRVAH